LYINAGYQYIIFKSYEFDENLKKKIEEKI